MIRTLYILKGCPCSGKSTWAKEFAESAEPNSIIIANRDTIRYQLGNGTYTMKQESKVTEIETQMVIDAMKEGKDIIIDDTNLNPKNTKVWYDLANEYNYIVKEKEFYIPYNESMKRSKARKEAGGLYIPRKVMLGFYERYYKEQLEDELRDYRIKNNNMQVNTDLPFCIICDIDGTFAMHNGRTPFDWNRLHEDLVDDRVLKILHTHHCNGDKIIFLTGRPECVRTQTNEWLEKNCKFDFIILMRPDSDNSSGDICKKRIYDEMIKDKYNVSFVLEDSNKCVDMWRNEGLLTLQVQNSDY